MNTQVNPASAERNQQALANEVSALSGELHAWSATGNAIVVEQRQPQGDVLLDRLATIFQLSPFERRVLLAAAAVELDSGFRATCAQVQGDANASFPTFEMMLNAFADAHWDALSPSAPLRAWRLILLSSGETLLRSRIRIDERILHYLIGVRSEDPHLLGLWQPLKESHVPLIAAHATVASRAALLLTAAEDRSMPIVQLLGADGATRQSVAAAAAARAGLQLGRISVALLPGPAAELYAVARVLDREAVLSGLAFYIPLEDLDSTDAGRLATVTNLIDNLAAPLIVASEASFTFASRETILFELTKPDPAEQSALWQQALGPLAASLNGSLDRLSSHFHLSAEKIKRNTSTAAALLQEDHSAHDPATDTNGHQLADTLWDICRTQSRVRMDTLAQRVETDATWDDLVLPAKEITTLKQIASQMDHRLRVQQWGFKSVGGRGMGLTAIFAGASGTGKTMAAEVLGRELKLDLFRVDLSQTVSKYIGETSRNLRRIFDTAEEAGAILLFDEADALFGKRTEVRDSHDRYANTEVSYLLQRMELYRGLAVLSTNMKQAIDSAFLRRVRFVVQFAFPDAPMREAIWRRAFPAQAPTDGLNFTALARLSMTGANIRNIALNGAFLAAAEDQPIRMSHLLEAAKGEAAKLERPLADQEVREWR